ncbi:hypothetical protein AAH994_05900 [Weeksellaceae bacterium A-14]|uniref:hypothetical protein n=1 Tax=Daejeonia sp. YH14 TaxID=3439042 RepID=UPI0031E4A5F4
MKTIYKVFLVLLVIFIAFNLYAIDWSLGVLADENAKFLFSLGSGIVGIFLVFILDTWSKLSTGSRK